MSDHGGSHDHGGGHGHSGGSHGGGGGFKNTITLVAVAAVGMFVLYSMWAQLNIWGFPKILICLIAFAGVFSLVKGNWRITAACLVVVLFLWNIPKILAFAESKFPDAHPRSFFPEGVTPLSPPAPAATPAPASPALPVVPPAGNPLPPPPVMETVTVEGETPPPPEFTPSDMAFQLSDNPWCRYSNPGVIGCYLWIKNNTEKARTVYLRDSSWSDGINAGWIPSATSLHCGDEHRTYICTIMPGAEQRILIQIASGDRDATEASFDLQYWDDTAGQYLHQSYSNLSLTPGVPE